MIEGLIAMFLIAAIAGIVFLIVFSIQDKKLPRH